MRCLRCFVGVAALGLTQCGTVIPTVDPVGTDGGIEAGSTLESDGGQVDGQRDAGDGWDGKTPRLVDCLGVTRTVFLCDDFERSSLDPIWTRFLDGAGADLSIQTGQKASGLRGLASGFSVLPTSGRAQLRYPVPRPGPIALQLSILIVDDPWSVSNIVELAALRAGEGDVAVLEFVPTGVGADGSLRVRSITGNEINFGPVVVGRFDCYQLAWADGRVHASRGLSGMATINAPPEPTRIDIGMTWSHGASNNSKATYYDDVIVSPEPIDCIR